MRVANTIVLILSLTQTMGQDLSFPPAPNDSLRIAFVSYKTGSADIFLMRADGSYVEQITNTIEDNSFPYQIDDRTLGFTRTDSLNNATRFKIDIYTKEESLIMENPIVDGAKWEVSDPQNESTAFIRSTDYSNRELFVYNSRNDQETKITFNSQEAFRALSVGYSWSPNGRYLIFLSGPDWYNQFIRLYDSETQEQITLTDRGYMNSGIRWLNDNETLIANLKIREETLYEIYSVTTPDGRLTQLTEGINLHPDVSPDGEWIVFESQRHENYGEAYIMRKDGSDQRRLTSNEDYNGRCTWFDLRR